MDIAVIGITPVGCTIACLLSAAGEDVTIIGPPEKAERIARQGITVRQAWNGAVITSRPRAAAALDHSPGLIVFAARTQDTAALARGLAPVAQNVTIATIQYGTKTEQIAAVSLPRDNIVTCVLTLGATCRSAGDVTLNFKGHMVVGGAYRAERWRVEQVADVMSKVFDTHVADKIAHYNCTRLLLNLPYCIPAIIGESVQATFSDDRMSAVAVMLLSEGIRVIEAADVHIEPLPDFDEGSLRALLSAPLDEAAGRFREMTMRMSKYPCQGPVLDSIEHGESSEIDYINGELVNIANTLGYPAPLNSLMVELVHRVETEKRFIGKEKFLEYLKQKHLDERD